jgi:hypothetical protein
MEIAIPLVALAGLYISSNDRRKQQTSQKKIENFQNYKADLNSTLLPNTDIMNKNYPEEYPINPTSTELDQSSKLSTVNKFDSPSVYTDKYFNHETYAAPESGETYRNVLGETVNKSYFEHNNMTPYFGSKVRSNIGDYNGTESQLDSYTGTGTQSIQKSEQPPLFNPAENSQCAYGAPNQNDFFQGRVNPSMRMANTKPFESQLVGPGLGDSEGGIQGRGGFNSGMEMRESWMPKTVDELRTNNNSRAGGIGLLGHEGPANHMTKTIGSIGKVEKNRVERAWDHGPERYFTTNGVQKGSIMNSIPVLRNVNRPETTMSYSGIATSQNPPVQSVTGEYMESKHMDLGPVPFGVANAVGHKDITNNDYGIESKRAYPNNRTTTGYDTYFGAFSGAIGAVIAPLLDELRPSRKENVIGTLRPYQNAKSNIGSSYIFNPADRPVTTIRETTEKNKYVSGVNKNQNGGSYIVTPHQAIMNERLTTSHSYTGGSSASSQIQKLRPYDAEYRQRNNDIKSSTIQGHMVKGNTSIMNSSIAQKNRAGELKNIYQPAITSAPKQIGSTDFMGKTHPKQDYNSTIQLQRNTPEMLDAFRNNPYTHSLTSVV